MRNTPNMSYCMYENTLDALRQINESDSRTLSDRERRAHVGLMRACAEFLESRNVEVNDSDLGSAIEAAKESESETPDAAYDPDDARDIGYGEPR